MLSLLAALAVTQQVMPPELTLPLDKSIALSDTLAQKLPPQAGSRDIRGCIVADDGSAIFWGREKVSKIDVGASTCEEFALFHRKWLPNEFPITPTKMEEFKRPQADFVALDGLTIVSARDKNSFLLEYSFHPSDEDRFRSAIAEIGLGPTESKLVLKPTKGGFATNVVADLASDSLLGQYFKDDGATYSFDSYRVVGKPERISGNIVPGIVPTVFDSTQNTVLCFTFTEEGTPYALLIERLFPGERVRLANPGGRVAVSALLPKARIVETSLPFRDSDTQEPGRRIVSGLYEVDPPYDTPKFLGPYRLVGSSRNGKWLLISHLKTKKAWLISPKP